MVKIFFLIFRLPTKLKYPILLIIIEKNTFFVVKNEIQNKTPKKYSRHNVGHELHALLDNVLQVFITLALKIKRWN